MAGSFNHVTNKKGQLRDSESYRDMIDHLGDAYEATEEMYGMIWWLAKTITSPGIAMIAENTTAEEWIEMARQKYKTGISLSPTKE